MTTWTGTVPTIASGDTTTVPTNLATYRDVLKALSEAWTSYTPTWTGSTTNPVLNNGTMVAAYQQINKRVSFRCVITMGSTTTYGSGTWIWTLPVAAAAGYVTFSAIAGCGIGNQGASTYPFGVSRYSSSTTMFLAAPSGSPVSNLVPFTWANGNVLSFSGTYEAA